LSVAARVVVTSRTDRFLGRIRSEVASATISRRGLLLLEDSAWVREENVDFRGGRTLIDASQIRNKDLRERVEEVGAAGTALDVGCGAVHVHLTVAHIVEPGPGNGGLARRKILRDVEVEGVDAVDSVGRRVVAVLGTDILASIRSRELMDLAVDAKAKAVEVRPGVGRAPLFNALDDPPAGGILDFLRVSLVSDGDLA